MSGKADGLSRDGLAGTQIVCHTMQAMSDRTYCVLGGYIPEGDIALRGRGMFWQGGILLSALHVVLCMCGCCFVWGRVSAVAPCLDDLVVTTDACPGTWFGNAVGGAVLEGGGR